MSDNKPKQTPKSIQAQVEGELRESKMKAVKAEVKTQVEKVQKAEKLLATEKAALEDIFEQNAELFS